MTTTHKSPFLGKPSSHAAIRVTDDSMQGIINQGDAVLYDFKEQITEGCIVAIKLKNDEQYIRRFHFKNHRAVLTSSNPEYKPITVNPDNIELISKIVKVIRVV